VQPKLDKLHAVVASAARGADGDAASSAQSMAAKLESLRHEARFAKARRARAMNRRVAANAGGGAAAERRLAFAAAAAPPTAADLAELRE